MCLSLPRGKHACAALQASKNFVPDVLSMSCLRTQLFRTRPNRKGRQTKLKYRCHILAFLLRGRIWKSRMKSCGWTPHLHQGRCTSTESTLSADRIMKRQFLLVCPRVRLINLAKIPNVTFQKYTNLRFSKYSSVLPYSQNVKHEPAARMSLLPHEPS